MITGESPTRFGWFCLRARPRREHAAATHLHQRTGVEVFSPRIRIAPTMPASTGAVGGAEALFPGYLFARFNYPQQLRHVVSTQGVTGMVAFGGKPPTVADGVIEFLRAQVSTANRIDPAPVFAEGTWVRIVAGCFREVEGQVLSFDSKNARVRVLLNLLGRDVQVSVPAQQLASAQPGTAVYPVELRASPRPVALVHG